MDLATAIIIIGTFLGGSLFIMDKYLHDRKFTTRKRLLLKFEEIKDKGIKLHDDMEYLVLQCNTELLNEFDSRDCLEALKEKIDIEYSDHEYQKLKKMKLTKENIVSYSERFKYHQDAIISLRMEYNQQLQKLDRQGLNYFRIY